MLRYCHAAACRLLVILMCLMAILSAVVLALKFPGAVAILIGFGLWRRARSWRGPQTSHGSARFATLDELVAANLLSREGLVFGSAELVAPPTRLWGWRALFSPAIEPGLAVELFLAALFPSRAKCERLIRLRSPVHAMVVAGTGRGKAVSVFIPVLLSYRNGGIVCVDPKAELWARCAEHRERAFGRRCYRIDPFGLDDTVGENLNPLSFIDPTSSDFLDTCRDLATAIVVREPEEREPHWNDGATIIITCGIAYVRAFETNPEACNLVTVRRLLSSRHRYGQMVERMQQAEGFGGVIATLGHMMSWFQGDELASVLTHVQRHTQFLDSPDVAACVSSNSLHPRELRSGRADVFLCLPPTRLRSLAGLQRLWISTLIGVLAQGTPSEKSPVMFLIDEAAHIGHIPILEDAITLMRGHGIRIFLAFQSLTQLKESYGDHAAVVLDNIDTQLYFGIGHDTAEALSKKLGDATILIDALNETTSTSQPQGGASTKEAGQVSRSRSLTTSAHGRVLARPDELVRMDDTVGILLHRNVPPIPVRLIRHFNFDGFRNGGTGETPRMGPRAVVAAAAALVLVGVLAIQVLRLPVVAPRPWPVARPMALGAPYGARPYPPSMPVYRSRSSQYRPFYPPVRRSYLIRVP